MKMLTLGNMSDTKSVTDAQTQSFYRQQAW